MENGQVIQHPPPLNYYYYWYKFDTANFFVALLGMWDSVGAEAELSGLAQEQELTC